jgi:hypothetical protein
MTATLSPARIGRDVTKALIADAIDHDSDARATLAMEIRSVVSVLGFFADGSVVVAVGDRWHVLIVKGEVEAVRAADENIQPPPVGIGCRVLAQDPPDAIGQRENRRWENRSPTELCKKC